MKSSMRDSLKHAKCLAKEMSRCDKRVIVHFALKELGVPSGNDGFPLAKITILMLCENRFCKLKNGAYLAAGTMADPPMDNEQVYQAISRGIHNAWDNRDERIWQCYFPKGTPGHAACPSNRDFLFAIVDFVELWEGCCEEVNYAKQ